MAQYGPKIPEMAQDGPKMAPRWFQDGLRETPKLASRVSEVRILQKIGYAVKDPLSKRPQSGPRTAQDGPRRGKMAPRRPGDGLKTARRRRQDGTERPQVETINPRIGVSCRRGANFAKSAMHHPSSEVVSLKWRKIDVG